VAKITTIEKRQLSFKGVIEEARAKMSKMKPTYRSLKEELDELSVFDSGDITGI